MAIDIFTLGIILIVSLGLIGLFVLIIIRKTKAVKFRIWDLRNPNRAMEKYYGFFDKKKGRWNLYSMLLDPIKRGIAPPFDGRAFSKDGVIECVRGASDNPEDDMIVPVRKPIVGQAGARTFANQFRDALLDRLQTEIKTQVPVLRDGKPKIIDKETGEIEMKEVTVKLPSANLSEKLEAMITKEWIMHTVGIVPVDDANVILVSEKDAIATFNSTINDKVNDKQSWLKQNTTVLLFIMGMFVCFVGAAIAWYHPGQTVSAVQTVSSAVNNIPGV